MTGVGIGRKAGNPVPYFSSLLMATYVGLDVSKDVFDAHLPQGVVRFAQTPTGYAQLLAALPAEAIVVLEATGPYGLRLLEALQAANQDVSVVNPLAVRRFAQSRLRRSKTDRLDAQLLTAFGHAMTPPLTPATNPELAQLRQRQALLELLRRQLGALRNHQHALQLSPWPDPVSEAALEEEIAQLEKRIGELEAGLDQAVAAREEAQRLRAIPGIGPRIVAALVLLGPGLKAFTSWRQAVAYAGLCPRHYESGSSVRSRPRLSKLGEGRLRRLLYLGACSAARFNPACQALYARLLARGKAKQQALCAVAARLLRQAWALVKFDRKFDPAYHLKAGN